MRRSIMRIANGAQASAPYASHLNPQCRYKPAAYFHNAQRDSALVPKA